MRLTKIENDKMLQCTEILEGAYLSARNSGHDTDYAMTAMKAKAFDIVPDMVHLFGDRAYSVVWCCMQEGLWDMGIVEQQYSRRQGLRLSPAS